MGRFNYDIPNDFIKQLNSLQDNEVVKEKVLSAGCRVLANRIAINIKSVIQHKEESTGDLVNSITQGKMSERKSGKTYMPVMFKGVDRFGIRNGLKAAELEYGNSHQRATPYMDKSISSDPKEIQDAMQEAFNQEVGKNA